MSYASISIRDNFPEVAAQLNKLAVDVGNKAMARALNKSIDQGKIQMARQISSEFRVSVGTVKDRLRVIKASSKNGATRFVATLEATKKGKGRSMNLIAFLSKARVSKAAAKRKGRTDLAGQLQFQIKRGGGKKTIKGAFVGNQGRTVFIREGRSRLPIKALNTIDIGQMFNTRRVNKVVRRAILEKFEKNFERELRSVMKGYVK